MRKVAREVGGWGGGCWCNKEVVSLDVRGPTDSAVTASRSMSQGNLSWEAVQETAIDNFIAP